MKIIKTVKQLLKLADKEQTVKFTENVEFHCDIGNWSNQINVSIQTTGSLHFLKSVNVISLQAGWSISAGENISAGRDISAGLSISAGWSISAGGNISAGQDISAEKITAMSVKSDRFEVKCKTLITSRLPFWRQFWAFQLPLLKWKDAILNNKNCWKDLKQLATIEEKEAICNWKGWHPILKAQLQMFFELKKEVNFQ